MTLPCHYVARLYTYMRTHDRARARLERGVARVALVGVVRCGHERVVSSWPRLTGRRWCVCGQSGMSRSNPAALYVEACGSRVLAGYISSN